MAGNLNGPIFMTAQGGGGTGVTPPFLFSKDGNATVGTSLRTGVAASNKTGQATKGLNIIVEIQASNSRNVGSTTRIQLTRRTAVTTFTDITNAFVDIPAGNYRGSNKNLSILLNADEELGAYVKSGVTLGDPVVAVYLAPAGGG